MTKLDDLRTKSQEEAGVHNASFKCLVYGDFGTGKTRFLTTARRPILIDFFDPEGWEQPRIRQGRSEGWIIAGTQWSRDDLDNPHTFSDWVNHWDQMEKEGVFKEIGTYAVDSFTTMSNALMREIIKRAGRKPTSQPQQNDYGVLVFRMRNVIEKLVSLPCDFILTAHAEDMKDELSGKIETKLNTTKYLRGNIPLLFGEVYLMTASEDSKGISYRLLTQSTGRFNARTCIGGDLFDTYEEPDIKRLLEKAGLPWEREDVRD